MRENIRLEDIDQLLNELEQLARSNVSQSRFLSESLNRLAFLLSASACAIMARPTQDQWIVTASRGAIEVALPKQLLLNVRDSDSFVCSEDHQWLVIPIRPKQWQRGALLVKFTTAFSVGSTEEVVRLCQAFAEILATRQLSELEYLLDEKWAGFQKSLLGIANSSSTEECAYLVVNDLATVVKADRVSLVQMGGWGARVLAISGVSRIEKKAVTVNSIAQICREAIVSKRTLSQQNSERSIETSDQPNQKASPILGNYICVPMARANQGEITCNSAILFEWSEYETFLFGCSTLNYLFPPLVAAWLQQQQVLLLPRTIRKLLDARGSFRFFQWGSPLMRVTAAVVLGVAGWWIANLPSDLRIEAEGTLQPVEQRIAYASMDGVVSRLLVSDGQQVAADEPLIEMRSPTLELQLQEVLGDIRANTEKKDGLNLAINQLSREAPGSFGMQGKLSSEVRELEIRLRTLEERKSSLLSEQKKLVIRSPIGGTIVARQVERFLDSRPIRQGEGLLRVVKLDGPWRLELQISDQDSGYVKKKLFGQESKSSGTIAAGANRQLEFALAARPSEKFTANATWMSESARNPRGDGMFVELMADVAPEVSQIGHMGATVNAYCNCGKQPLWFVWTRKLVEAAQRRFWF